MKLRKITQSVGAHAASAAVGVFAYRVFLTRKQSLASYADFLAQVYGTGMCLLPLVKQKYNAVVRHMHVDAPISVDAAMNSVELIWTNKEVLEGVKTLMQESLIEEMYN